MAVSPKIEPMITRSNKFIFCLRHTAISPANVEQYVAINIGRNMSEGLAAPICALYTITPKGTKVSPVVFNTRNMIIGLLAVSLSGFISCISFIAFRPRGVAALSSHSIFEETFMKIDPNAGWFLGRSGKSLQKRGLISRENKAMIPPRSPIFINPSHKDRTPVSPNDISKAVLAEVNEEFMISFQIVRFPKNTD